VWIILGAFEAQTKILVKIRNCNSKSHNIQKRDLVESSELNQRYLTNSQC
jgi:hypothetical protein